MGHHPLYTGKLDLAPKRTAIKKTHEDSLRLTKAINADNEEHFAGMAAKSGGRLTLVRAGGRTGRMGAGGGINCRLHAWELHDFRGGAQVLLLPGQNAPSPGPY